MMDWLYNFQDLVHQILNNKKVTSSFGIYAGNFSNRWAYNKFLQSSGIIAITNFFKKIEKWTIDA